MIIDENQKLRSELESQMQELDSRSKQLDELASQSDYDRRNLQQEKEKVCDGLLLLCSFLYHEVCVLFCNLHATMVPFHYVSSW
jgi:hypothetical protein